MKINKKGLELVQHFEGLYLEAYKCPANVWTIGWGCTDTNYAYSGNKITKEKAEYLLKKDMEKFEEAVTGLIEVPLNENQFSALVSFSFNVGAGALSRSTLRRYLNAGSYNLAASEFKRWNKGGGRVLPGLVRRRKAEMDLFLEPVKDELEPLEKLIPKLITKIETIEKRLDNAKVKI